MTTVPWYRRLAAYRTTLAGELLSADAVYFDASNLEDIWEEQFPTVGLFQVRSDDPESKIVAELTHSQSIPLHLEPRELER